MAELTPQSPLAHRSDLLAYRDRPVTLSEVSGRAMIDVRLAPDDKVARAAVEKVLGVALPQKPRSSNAKGETSVLWLSIDQWLVTAPIAGREDLMQRLEGTLLGSFALVCDMSDARAILRLEGDGAAEVMMKGGAPDLTSAEFKEGSVRRMMFAEIAAMCHCVSAKPRTLDVYVFRSYADYAWEWLAQTSHPNAEVRLWTRQETPPA